MKIREKYFLSAIGITFLFAFGAGGQTRTLPSAIQDAAGRSSAPAAVSDQAKEAAAAEEEDRRTDSNYALTSAVKRNFSTRYGLFLTEKDKQAVAMDAADAEEFDAFLDRDDAGFARLYDASNCELNQRILNVADECPPNISGRGISYSFRKRKYQHAFFSDLRLHQDVLQATGLNVLGLLTNLGDAEDAPPLDSISLDSEGVRALAEFQPAVEVEAANKQIRAAATGFRVGEFFYKNALPLKENHTYAMRAVAFQGKVVRRFRGFEINVLSHDKRHDVIVVFRVIRRHANGSVSLLWRELQRIEAPRLEFPKRRKDNKDESRK
jgi:hypothetical protein